MFTDDWRWTALKVLIFVAALVGTEIMLDSFSAIAGCGGSC
jgi:hypothetical protein